MRLRNSRGRPLPCLDPQRAYIAEKDGMAIEVSGAGTEPLNGTYIRNGTSAGLPKWSRRGMDIW
jgi:hypothetical protein